MSEPPKGHIHLVVPRAQAARWIRKQVAAGRKLPLGNAFWGSGIEAAVHACTQWLDVVGQMLSRIFDKPDIADDWRKRNFAMVGAFRDFDTRSRLLRAYRDESVSKLEGILQRLPFIEEDPSVHQPASKVAVPKESERAVFIVHGHDTAAKEAVARFLMQLKLTPIILEEEVSAGQTIIEKLETSSEVGFVVVIMTPDDVGAVKDHPEALKPRARQNVISERHSGVGVRNWTTWA